MSSEPGDQETRAAGGRGVGAGGRAGPGHLWGLCRWDICCLTCSSAGPALLPEAVAAAEPGLGQSNRRGTLLPSYCEIIIIYSNSSVTGSWEDSAEAPYPLLASSVHISGGCHTTWKPADVHTRCL